MATNDINTDYTNSRSAAAAAISEQNNLLLSYLRKILDKKQPYKDFDGSRQPKILFSEEDMKLLPFIRGSLVGLAIGDALGASVEFRPHAYMKQNPVETMESGGTWGLKAGQWTDDTSMALCLAASLIMKEDSDSYDQMVRFQKWHKKGYMSSTGKCFDIGTATRDAMTKFGKEQDRSEKILRKEGKTKNSSNRDNLIGEHLDRLDFNLMSASETAAGNGALMRLAPIPLFYHYSEHKAVNAAGNNCQLTHGDPRAIDASRFYAALIQRALRIKTKAELLNPVYYERYFQPKLHPEIQEIVRGSYSEKKGYEGGIRGAGFVVKCLEAALWAFHFDGDSFEKGVLKVVNLGDDTDTTAAIYGQLAGAFYGIDAIPDDWRKILFRYDFIVAVADGLYLAGQNSATTNSSVR